MKLNRKFLLTAAALFAMCAHTTAHPASIVLNFNGLSDGDTNGTILTYLNVVAPGLVKSVTGAVAEQDYAGDGYVESTGTNGNKRYLTLGTSDGAASTTDFAKLHAGYDTFLRNVGGEGSSNTPFGSAGNDKIVFEFFKPIYGISFDWEVFPDAVCKQCDLYLDPPTNSVINPKYPDFELWVGNGSSLLKEYSFDQTGHFPVIDGTIGKAIGYPQGLGHFSAIFPGGVTRVEFVDWPVLVGIDNVDPEVPEPGSLALAGLALAALGAFRRRLTS